MARPEWEDQDADFEAEMAMNREADMDDMVYAHHSEERERFTTYDQHGWLDSEWQR